MQRALTLKILIISFLSILMLIPLSMIGGKIDERDYYRTEATQSVARSWTGSQKITTPILVIPYTEMVTQRTTTSSSDTSNITTNPTLRYRLIGADKLEIQSSVETSTRMRGIYKIPVYESIMDMKGSFAQDKINQTLSSIQQTENLSEIHTPYMVVGVSDPRGINNAPNLKWNTSTFDFEPGTKLTGIEKGLHAELPELGEEITTDMSFQFSLNVRGMEALSFIPTADFANIHVHSPWPHPEFIGAFLPNHREISPEGFIANWNITQFSSGAASKLSQCQQGNCSSLAENSLGVNLTDPVDIYLQSDRSVKYGILFIGLSFIGFFIFENLKKMRIHPIQYGLVGLSITTFYMLLISLSEHINFGLSYAIATVACVSLIFSYLKFVLAGTRNSIGFAGALSALYAALYVIIQAEDFALLMGTVLVFAILALVMLITRKIDWYEVGEQVSFRAPDTSVNETDKSQVENLS